MPIPFKINATTARAPNKTQKAQQFPEQTSIYVVRLDHVWMQKHKTKELKHNVLRTIKSCKLINN